MRNIIIVCLVYVATNTGTFAFEFPTKPKAATFLKQVWAADNVTGTKLECK